LFFPGGKYFLAEPTPKDINADSENETCDEHGHKLKCDCNVFSMKNKISRQFPEWNRTFFKKKQKQAERKQKNSRDEKKSRKRIHGHRLPLPLAIIPLPPQE
jgi:hypothetical protein